MAAVLFAFASLGPLTLHAQQFPFGAQHQAYRPGTLFPSGSTRAQHNQDVADYYDVFKSRWLAVDPGGNGWRVKLDPSGRTVSEGQGYGMVIVAAMAGHDPQAKTIFDGLWQFALAHPSSGDSRLMDWDVPAPAGNDSAFDGDADIAYGLLMAHAQWGSAGAIDYLAAAQTVIAGIRASTIGPQSRLPMLGDWVDADGDTYSQWTTRSSDFMPGHFRAYGSATGDIAFWNSVVSATQNVVSDIQANESAATGLLPDFIRLAGSARDPQPAPNLLEGANDGNYWYNAGRDPWRLGVDAILNNDPVSLAQVQKISNWARTASAGDPDNITAGYQLDGTALNDWQDIFYIAPLAVAAMTGNGAADQQWLDSLYARVRQAHNADNYYADAVTLQSLLAVTGNFWDPMTVLAAPRPAGDFDGDGDVDGADLDRWRTSFGTNALADANGDGRSDGLDFLLWQRNFLPPANSTAPVPEPTAAVVALGLVAAFIATHDSRLSLLACRR